ncbi:hypothetical protein O9H85_16800 [Paenibacillus filicis]|uniref:Uncharacterized protein n=1 Tax=Paenibacillus gyeongsangnamensis TaxID=3388067 RepID=A0ABT4QAZ1_9BACL|nr:hypothetical protein [Paenibacillus filicis]MCZ8514052.1 hypothetical protein [Paenibacillus filicis]
MIFAPMSVNLLGFKVNVLDRDSTLSFGPSQKIDVFISSKQNMGFGENNGDLSPIFVPMDIILDSDVLDNVPNKNSIV